MIRLRRFVLLTLAFIAVLIALLTVAGSYVASQVPEYRQDIEANLAEAFGRHVTLDEVRLVWRGIYPQAQVKGLRLPALPNEPSAPIQIEQLDITLDPVALVQGKLQPLDIEIQGVTAHVLWISTGRTLPQIRQKFVEITSQLNTLAEHGQLNLHVRDADILLTVPALPGLQMPFNDVVAEASVDNGVVTVLLNAQTRPELGEQIYAVITAKPEDGSGSIRVQMTDLQAQEPLLVRLTEEWLTPLSGAFDVDTTMAWQADAFKVNTELNLRALRYQLNPAATVYDAAQGALLSEPVANPPAPQMIQQMQTKVAIEHRDDTWWIKTDGLAVNVAGTPWLKGDIELRQDSDGVLSGQVDYARLDDVLPLVQPWLEAALPSIGGALQQTRFVFDPVTEDWSVWADAENIHIEDDADFPGLQGVTGELTLQPNSGQLVFDSTQAVLSEPQIFIQDLVFEQLKGQVNWTKQADRWAIDLSDLDAVLPVGRVQGGMRVAFGVGAQADDASPPEDSLTVEATLSQIQAEQLAQYLPLSVMSDALKTWWQQALLGGTANAELTLRSGLHEFAIGETTDLTLLASFDDAAIRYHPDWPIATEVQGRAEWRNQVVTVQIDKGLWNDYPLTDVTASIPDLSNPYIDLSAALQGEPQAMIEATTAIPVAEVVFARLAENTYKGFVNTDLELHLGLQGQTDGYVKVRTQLQDVHISEPNEGMVYAGVNGVIEVTDQTLSAQSLRATVLDIPLQINLSQDFAKQDVPEVTLQGELDLQKPAKGYALVMQQIEQVDVLPYLSGQVVWQGRLHIDAEQPARIQLHIKSDLVGLQSELTGLQKSLEDEWPLMVNYRSERPGHQLISLRLQDRLSAQLQWLPMSSTAEAASELTRAAVRLGRSEPLVALPAEKGYYITGQWPAFAWDQWDFSRSDDAEGANDARAVAVPLVIEDLTIGDLQAFGFTVPDITLSVRSFQDDWTLQMSAPTLEANLYGQTAPVPSVSGRVSRLWLPTMKLNKADDEGLDAMGEDEALDALLSEGRPSDWPLFDIQIDDFRVGEFIGGAWQLKIDNTLTGLKVNVVANTEGNSSQADIKGQATLRWDYFIDGSHTTDLQGEFKISNIQRLLDAIQQENRLNAERTSLRIRAAWDRPPEAFDLADLYGDVRFDIKDGVLYQVEPGVGRLVGLLNFYRLPARLTGDFRDLTESGMAFDELSGTFNFADGNAYSSDLAIQSAAADADFVGRIGLAAEDYDIRARIYPKLSSGVGVAGAIVSGLSTGGLLLLAQEIFAVPLRELTQIRYHLEGSWGNPELSEMSIGAEGEDVQVIENPMSSSPMSPNPRSSNPRTSNSMLDRSETPGNSLQEAAP